MEGTGTLLQRAPLFIEMRELDFSPSLWLSRGHRALQKAHQWYYFSKFKSVVVKLVGIQLRDVCLEFQIVLKGSKRELPIEPLSFLARRWMWRRPWLLFLQFQWTFFHKPRTDGKWRYFPNMQEMKVLSRIWVAPNDLTHPSSIVITGRWSPDLGGARIW